LTTRLLQLEVRGIKPCSIDEPTIELNNSMMSVEASLSGELLRTLEQRLLHAASGVRDLEAMREACEHMDQEREDLRRRIGTVEVAVGLIRETREE
jgi:hypothetical protein